MDLSNAPIRPSAHAGRFYPSLAGQLRRDIAALLDATAQTPSSPPRAVIVPHAGYIYSACAAARAFAWLERWRSKIRRVVMVGPAHYVAVERIALSGHDAFVTPLGEVPVDRDAVRRMLETGMAKINNAAHAPEHSLEVQLPFLQSVLDEFVIVPALIGDMPPAALAAFLEPWWDDPETLLLVSTDLSHFLDYAGARLRDARTDEAIMSLDGATIGPQQACGCHGLNGLLYLARTRAATVERLALLNSGDTAGDRERVVGYAAYAVY